MKRLLVFIVVSFLLGNLLAQQTVIEDGYDQLKQHGELYLSVEILHKYELINLSKLVSIDRIENNRVYFYANLNQFEKFVAGNYSFEILKHPGKLIVPVMRSEVNTREALAWDFYPTYEAYVDIMYQFAGDYPEICHIESIKTLPSGREILIVKISDDVEIDEGEPEFLYTSSMHGDELGGYVMMLHLIDYFLDNYSVDQRVTDIINNVELWINPLANPDGAYAGGNSSVYGATRGNANYIDLNRNFPDPEDGPHPDGNAWQPETIAFMDFAEGHDFVMSANFHGGSELINYPFDTWSRRAADDHWWQFVSYEYADTVHANSSNYFYDEGDGVTNGYDWYSISGGRQDYMNFFHQCRESTIELSSVKILPENQLMNLWDYNFASLVNYIEQVRYGVQGIVTDSITGNPVAAKIQIDGHDLDSSHVYASSQHGNYYRLLYEGSYDISFLKKGYFPKTIENVTVENYETVILDVELVAGELIADFHADKTTAAVGTTIQFLDESYGDIIGWEWHFDGGTPTVSYEQNPEVFYAEPGNYDVSLTITSASSSNTLLKTEYIDINLEYLMSDNTVSVCSGVFYDSGGSEDNYSDSENFIMTLIPAEANHTLRITFEEFSIEYHSTCDYDWLQIFDGNSVNSPLIGTYCGTDSPGIIMASNAEGALTFRFQSDGYVNESGWSADVSCVETVGKITSADAGFAMECFPNPVNDILYLKMQNDSKNKGSVSFRIFSLQGQIVLSGKEEQYMLKDIISIDVSAIPAGIYILQATLTENSLYRRIVIQ